jgi:hypothetical protein
MTDLGNFIEHSRSSFPLLSTLSPDSTPISLAAILVPLVTFTVARLLQRLDSDHR